jgi:DNA-binding MltR family transcriptional regulator
MVQVTHAEPDGSLRVTESTWDEAFGHLPEYAQLMPEVGHLANTVLNNESQRAVGVLAPAYLEAILDQLLRQYLMEGEHADELLGSDRALGTFSARTHLAAALGFVSEDAYHDLEMIRRIRNLFAHDLQVHTFAETEVRNRCLELRFAREMFTDLEARDARGLTHVFIFTVLRLVSEIANGMRYAIRRVRVPDQAEPGLDPNRTPGD